MRGLLIFSMLALLSGCGGGIIPPGAQRPAPSASRPASSTSPRPSAPRPPVTGSSAVAARPVPATPAAPLPAPISAADGNNAAALGVVAGPPVSALGVPRDRAGRALAAFRTTCPSLVRRTDKSGLTRPDDWAEACRAAANWPTGEADGFFHQHFTPVQVGDGRAYATGYFEPEIAASRTRRAGYEVPIYGRPTDLVDVDLGKFSPEWAGKRIRGKVEGTNLVLYDDRAAIEAGALNGRAPVIAWAADRVELFFLQIQGSGRLRFPDGEVMRVGFASQNGRDYTGIGGVMRDRGLFKPGESTSMQGIMAWLRRNPEEGRRVMAENKSFVFFTEQKGTGPVGALGLPISGEVTVAADPAFVPLGAPVWLSLDRAEPNGLWVAQDTGGAIKGANRYDTFWGAGERARALAGGMSARGSTLILLPHTAAARLGAVR